MIRVHQRTPRRRGCSRSDPHTATQSQRVTAHTPERSRQVPYIYTNSTRHNSASNSASDAGRVPHGAPTHSEHARRRAVLHLDAPPRLDTACRNERHRTSTAVPIRHSGVQGGAEMGAYATGFPGGAPSTTRTRSGWRSCGGSRCLHLRGWGSPDRHSRRFASCPGWDRRGSAGDPPECPGMAAGSRERAPSSPSQVGDHVVLMCDEGYQSSLAAVTLQQLGFAGATDVEGGIQAWRAAGLPVEQPRSCSTRWWRRTPPATSSPRVGITASLGIIAATFPLLARITGPEVARNEWPLKPVPAAGCMPSRPPVRAAVPHNGSGRPGACR